MESRPLTISLHRTNPKILVSHIFSPFIPFVTFRVHAFAEAPFQLPLPYANFTALLAPPETNQAEYFTERWLALLDLVIDHLRRLSIADDGPIVRTSSLSYNFLMTETYIHVVPRTAESYVAPNGNKISINSLGFAGMVLVKKPEDLETIKRVGVLNVLKDLGFRPVASGESSHEVLATSSKENAPDTLPDIAV